MRGVIAVADGWGWRDWSSWGLERMRAISGSKNGVVVTLAGTGRPFTSTSRLLPGQAWAVST
jgi:hypothetical protein